MFNKLYCSLTAIVLSSAAFTANAQSVKPVAIESGVSYTLAQYRSKAISNLQYDIKLTIPEQKASAIQGQEKVTFTLKQKALPLQLDFKQSADHVQRIVVNKKTTTVNLQQEHLVINQQLLKVGTNEIEITFTQVTNRSTVTTNTYMLYLCPTMPATLSRASISPI